MDRQLFLSILSMDSYNRGGDGLAIEGNIGNASWVTTRKDLAFDAFSATHYSFAGQNVISFRGTDNMFTDAITGWVNGAGSVGTNTQLESAIEFYEDVTNQTLADGPSNAVLVGHSLGGGLAGFLGYVTGTEASVIDHMPYAGAAAMYITYAPVAVPSSNSVQAIYVSGEALVPVRAVSPGATLGALYPSVPVSVRDFANDIGASQTYRAVLDPHGARPAVLGINIDLHSQGLAVILEYASTIGPHTDWHNIGQEFIDALYDERIAVAATKNAADPIRQNLDSNRFRQAIAYSAIDVGARPFGDTAIVALFNDADQVGELSQTASTVQTLAQPLADTFVQYAGHLASQAITQSGHTALLAGIVAVDTPNEKVTVSFADDVWKEVNGGSVKPKIVGRDTFVKTILEDGSTGSQIDVNKVMKELWGSDDSNLIERVEISTNDTGATLTVGEASTPPAVALPSGVEAVVLTAAGGGNDIITGSVKNDFIFGAAGNDSITGGDGKDLLAGGSGDDTLDGGEGENQLFGGAGNDRLRYNQGTASFFDGGDGFDTIIGTDDDDQLIISSLKNIRNVEGIVGGGGSDILSVSDRTASALSGEQVHLWGKDGTIEGGSTSFDGDNDVFGVGGGITFIRDADADDAVVFGSFMGGLRITGGVQQWWSEGGVAAWAPFSSVASAVPIVGGNLLFGIITAFVDGPAMGMFQFGLTQSNQLEIQIAGGRLGAVSIENYKLDLDSGAASGGVVAFQQVLKKGGASLAELKHYLNLALRSGWGVGMSWNDPLVLDLDGDGLEFTSAPTTYFDMNADGWAEGSVWTRGGDGFLVRDSNANGKIDNISEMFGNATTSGLSALGVLDSNSDGKITAADTGFADLRVWVDANGDAITDAGELKTLASLNITEISLTPTGATGNVRGNTIAAQSTFTRGDGSTGTVADVNLITNFVDTQWLGDKTISGAAAALPELKAFGRLTDLRVAMTDDATLLASVDAFKNLSASTSWSSLQSAAAGILYRWASVDGVVATPITANFDRKMLAFLETYYGTQLTPRDGGGNPDPNNAVQLRASYDFILASETIRLAAQGPLSTLLGTTYELSSDRLISPSATTLADALRTVLTGLSSDPATALAAWNTNWAPIFSAFTTALVRADQNLVKTDYTVQSLVRAMDGLTQPLTLNQLVAGLGLSGVNIGTTGVDAFVRSGAPTDSAVFVGAGGNDTYTGDGGQAIYVYGKNFGQDTINDLDNKEYGDRIRFALHSQSEVTFTRSGNDLIISVNASTDKVTIKNQFLRGQFGSNYGVEEIQFADGTLLDVPHLMQVIGKGTSASELLTGTVLDDVLEGMAGNDTLRGGDGGDIYFYSAGHGQDVIEEIQTTPMNQAMDVLGIENGHGMGDIQFARTGESDDLQITFANSTDSILVKGQFWYNSLGVKGSTSPEGLVGLLLSTGAPFFDGAKLATENRIEQIVFKSGGVLDWQSIQQILIDQATTSGNDSTFGFGSVDYLKSSAGNDTLVGRDGGDTYEFGLGSGNDTIWDQARYITILGTDTVKFGAGLTLADLTFSRPTDAPDLVITINSTGETLTIKDQFAGQKLNLFDVPGFGVNWFSRIEKFTFESGASITWEDVLHTITTGTSGVDRLNGDWYADTIDGGAGNDHLNGRDDGDTYLFGIGDGQDVIEETRTWVIDSAPDTLQFKSNVAFADTSFHRVGETEDLIVSFNGSTDQVLIKGQYQVAETGPFGAQAYFQIEQFKWSDGTLRTWTQLTQQIIDAGTTSGADVVAGTHFADQFNASAGADTLKGGNGSDTYAFGIGSGADTVNDLASNILADNLDTVEFGAGVLPSDIIIERSGANDVVLKINGTTDQLSINGQFAYSSLDIRSQEVERFTFANGTTWTAADLRVQYLAQASTAAANVIEGFWSNDAINGLGGNDTLRGGDGSDVYTFAGSFGQDRIEETVGNLFYDDADSIVFGSGFNSTNATLTRAGDDLTIGFTGLSDTVTIVGQFGHSAFYSGWQDVESVTFGNAVTWTDAQIRSMLLMQSATAGADTITGFYTNDTLDGLAGNDTLRGAGGGDTYVFGKGSGQDRIEESFASVYEDQPDTVTFAANTTRAEVAFSRVGDNLVAAIAGVSDTLTIKDHFITNSARIEFFKFADGTTMTAAQAETNAVASQSTLGADTINGSSGDDIIDGGAGNDSLLGGQGNDTYVFGRGYGLDTINEDGGTFGSPSDRVAFKEGIIQSDLILSRTGNDLVIQISGASDQLTIKNQFAALSPNTIDTYQRVDSFVFSNGQTLSAAEIDALTLRASSSAGADLIQGYFSDETLDGGAGNDTLRGGPAGNDTYIFGRGYGQDTIEEDNYSYGNVSDAVRFNPDVAPGDLVFSRSGNNLIIQISGTSDQLTIQNQLWVQNSTDIFGGGRIESFYFADGTVWAASDIDKKLLTGTVNADTLTGFENGDTLDGGAGNDTLSGAQSGNDLYIFGRGYGQDVINEDSSGTGDTNDTLTFKADVAPEDIQLQRSGNNLIIKIAGTTDQITIMNQHWSQDSSDIFGYNRIENFVFADGTAWSAIDIDLRLLAESATSGNDEVRGYDKTDVLDGGAGNDTLRGYRGNDVYMFKRGSGQDIIDESNAGNGDLGDVLSLGEGIGLNDVRFTRSGNDLIVQIVGTSDQVTIKEQLSVRDSGNIYGVNRIELFTFADGSELSAFQVEERVLAEATSALGDVITGYESNDTLVGGPGGDTLIGAAGADTLNGGDGDDVLKGGAGADVLDGGSGVDTASYDGASALVLDRATPSNSTGDAVGDVFVGVEKFVLTGGADRFVGSADNEIIDGGFGADTMIGGGGDDVYYSDVSGDDITETAGGGNDTVMTMSSTYSLAASPDVENVTYIPNGNGASFAFTGTGNASANIIKGGIWQDTLDGAAGADTLIGGLQNDTYIVDSVGDVVVENAGEGTDTIRTALASYSMAIANNVENLVYTGAAAFTGTGNTAANSITGAGGNDTLDGGAAVDTLIGGLGNDTYIVDETADVVTEAASAGTDTIQSSATYSMASLANVEHLTLTGTGNINATGNSGANILTGNSGANILNGGAGTDTLIGGLGDDIYVVDSTTDTITEAASAGTDTIQSSVTFTIAALANIENITLTAGGALNATGNSGANVLIGGSGNNTLTGNDGNDTLDGAGGTDTLVGGLGNDTYIVDSTGDTITEAASAGTDTIQSSVTYTIASLANVENVTLTGAGNVNATGNGSANVLTGNAGNNTLNGSAGTDTLVGGDGNDIYVVDSTTDTITEAANGGTDTVQSSVTFSIAAIANVENVTLTATGAINATGNSGANVLTGGSGNNTLTGNDGDDTLNGGAGTDTLVGGLGNDTYIVDTTTDTITEAASAGTDTVQSSVTFTIASLANVENITLTAAGAINATGNSGANVLTGGAGNNTLTGNDGNDTLDGAGGTDTLVGGLGNDLYIVDTTTDTITEAASAGTDTVQSSVTYTIASLANVENITLTGTGAINATGNASANTLTGNDGANILTGGAGNDTLAGGLGNDVAIFAGNMSTYSIVTNSGSISIVDNNATADGNDGSDTLSAIEQAQFKDQTTNLSAPIVLDLNGDGVNLIDRASSHALFDWNGDGRADKTGWIAAGDGLLALDRNADGQLSGAKELTFIDDVKGARSDLEGLRAWDSNGDMSLSLQDAYFNRFHVFQDLNGDGSVQTGEWKSLNELGITSISLQGAATSQTWAISANIVINNGSYTTADGATHALADVAFNYQAAPTSGAALQTPTAKGSGDSAAPFRLRDIPGLQDWRMAPIDLDEVRDRLAKSGKTAADARNGAFGGSQTATAADFETSLGAAHMAGRGAIRSLGMEAKVLRMVESMSSFGGQGAVDLLLTDSKTLDPKVRELLTSLPDAKVG